MTQTQSQVALDSIVDTGVELEVTLHSELITLEDLEYFFRFVRQTLEAVEAEASLQLGEEVILVSDVKVSHSSAKSRTKIRTPDKGWSPAKRKILKTILAAAVALMPNIELNIEVQAELGPPKISVQCAETLQYNLREHNANARSQRIQEKDYKITFKSTCEGATVESTYEPLDQKTKRPG